MEWNVLSTAMSSLLPWRPPILRDLPAVGARLVGRREWEQSRLLQSSRYSCLRAAGFPGSVSNCNSTKIMISHGIIWSVSELRTHLTFHRWYTRRTRHHLDRLCLRLLSSPTPAQTHTRSQSAHALFVYSEHNINIWLTLFIRGFQPPCRSWQILTTSSSSGIRTTSNL